MPIKHDPLPDFEEVACLPQHDGKLVHLGYHYLSVQISHNCKGVAEYSPLPPRKYLPALPDHEWHSWATEQLTELLCTYREYLALEDDPDWDRALGEMDRVGFTMDLCKYSKRFHAIFQRFMRLRRQIISVRVSEPFESTSARLADLAGRGCVLVATIPAAIHEMLSHNERFPDVCPLDFRTNVNRDIEWPNGERAFCLSFGDETATYPARRTNQETSSPDALASKLSREIQSVSARVTVLSRSEPASPKGVDDWGFIYIARNPSMGDYLKVGCTTRNPVTRVAELSTSTSVPSPFELVFSAYVPQMFTTERKVHLQLTEAGARVSKNREFFQIDIQTAIQVVIAVQLQVTGSHRGT